MARVGSFLARGLVRGIKRRTLPTEPSCWPSPIDSKSTAQVSAGGRPVRLHWEQKPGWLSALCAGLPRPHAAAALLWPGQPRARYAALSRCGTITNTFPLHLLGIPTPQ